MTTPTGNNHPKGNTPALLAHARFQRAVRIADQLERHPGDEPLSELFRELVTPDTWETVDAILHRHDHRGEALKVQAS